MIRSSRELPSHVWFALHAGMDFHRAHTFMREARQARNRGDSRETVCMLVSWAREWHRKYRRALAQALAVQP